MEMVLSSVCDWMEMTYPHLCSYPLPQKLINSSSEVMNIHIIPTQTNHFQTTYTKKVFFFITNC